MMTLGTNSVNVQTLDVGHIVVDIDGANVTELINKAAENGYSLRMVDNRDSIETPATYTSPHQSLQDNAVIQGMAPLITGATLLSCIKQVRGNVLTLHHLWLLHQNR